MLSGEPVSEWNFSVKHGPRPWNNGKILLFHDTSRMNGKAGGIPAALADPENVPVESDYPHPNSVSQEVFEGQKDACERWPDVSPVPLGRFPFN